MKHFTYGVLFSILISFTCKPEHLRPCNNDPIYEFCKIDNLPEGWTVDGRKAPLAIHDIYFLNEHTGYLCGRQGGIAKTSDGGESWNLLTTSNEITTNAFDNIHFLNEDLGWVTSQRSPSGFFTEDGGDNWVAFEIPSATGILSIHFISPSLGFALCETDSENRLFKTTDSKLWSILDTDFKIWKNLNIIGNDLIIVTRVGNVYRSTDLGDSWDSLAIPFSMGYEGFFDFKDSSVWYAFPSQTKLMKTIDAGESWIELDSNFLRIKNMHLNREDGFYWKANQAICGGDLEYIKSYSIYTLDGNGTQNNIDLLPPCYGFSNYYRVSDNFGLAYHDYWLNYFRKK